METPNFINGKPKYRKWVGRTSCETEIEYLKNDTNKFLQTRYLNNFLRVFPNMLVFQCKVNGNPKKSGKSKMQLFSYFI